MNAKSIARNQLIFFSSSHLSACWSRVFKYWLIISFYAEEYRSWSVWKTTKKEKQQIELCTKMWIWWVQNNVSMLYEI